MGLFSRKKKGKVMVVGLDGVPCSLLTKLADNGTMPNVKRITGGKPKRMEVVYPEISSVSWPSFMTGKGPGEHGIFGFTDLLPESYDMIFPNYANLKAPTIWDMLAEKGKRSIIINQPGTYPARKVEGALISGFVAVDIFKSVFPTKYLGALKRMKYQVDIDTERSRKDADFLFEQLSQTMQTREMVYNTLREKEDWDYMEVVVTGTDRMQHYQMDAILDESKPNHQRTMDYYHEIDGFIGRMFAAYCADTKSDGANFIMLSDHGFTEIKQEVNINSWLMENGYLRFNGEGKRLADIAPESKAFALDPGRIFIHTKGRFPNGSVPAKEAAATADEIKQKLLPLEFNGEPVIKAIFTPKEIYTGPYVGQSADLIAHGHWGYDLKSALDGGPSFRKTDLTGMHTQDDAFLWVRDAFGDGANITEIAGHIMSKY